MFRQKNKEKVSDFRISFVNDTTHEQIWVRKFTRTSLTIFALAVVLVICLAVYCLVAFTPIRTMIPGYPDATMQRESMQNAIRIDSLENILVRWEFYAENLKRVVDGKETLNIDSLIRNSNIASAIEKDPESLSGADSLLRKTVREAEQFDVTGGKARSLPVEGRHFFCPLKGTVTRAFDPALHPYVDITAPANSVVMSALDGTVVFDGWNDEAGYTIVIQHSDDVVTVYKHNQKLLKQTGDKLSAGAPIALVGGAESVAAGDHLHFELWYNGGLVNPEDYINFGK